MLPAVGLCNYGEQKGSHSSGKADELFLLVQKEKGGGAPAAQGLHTGQTCHERG